MTWKRFKKRRMELSSADRRDADWRGKELRLEEVVLEVGEG